MSLYWWSESLHFKGPPNQVSHKSTMVDPIWLSQTWKGYQTYTSCALQNIKTNFPKNRRSTNIFTTNWWWEKLTSDTKRAIKRKKCFWFSNWFNIDSSPVFRLRLTKNVLFWVYHLNPTSFKFTVFIFVSFIPISSYNLWDGNLNTNSTHPFWVRWCGLLYFRYPCRTPAVQLRLFSFCQVPVILIC